MVEKGWVAIMTTTAVLKSAKVMGFVPTRDPKKARTFFEDVLGLKFVVDDKFALVFDANGTTLRVVTVKDFTPFQFTLLGWQVSDIEKVVSGLLDKGVKFERFSFMEQDELGIWSAPGGAKVAWFKDPDGNVLSVSQHP
jgi:catechol 2,3-dioxygenase-like lactoylglutathione lyase family enzyme